MHRVARPCGCECRDRTARFRPASPRPASLPPRQIPKITRHHDQPPAARVTGDQGVITANRLTAPLRIGAYFGGVGGRSVIEVQDLNMGDEPIDLPPDLCRPVGFFGPYRELGKDDRGQVERIGLAVETVTQNGWLVTQDTNAEIGVPQVAQNYKRLCGAAPGVGRALGDRSLGLRRNRPIAS